MGLEVKGFVETSFLDWDGKVVATLFLPLCNFRCPFCHNAGLLENPEAYETVPLSRIEEYLSGHRDFIDGVCLTGGEPSLHKDRGLMDFMCRVKSMGFEIKFDTNGSDPGLLAKLIDEKLIDYIAMDVKAPLDERYNLLCGIKADLEKIKRSVKMIMEGRVPYEFRVTVVPTLLNPADVEALAAHIAGAEKLVLQQFVAQNALDPALRFVAPYTEKDLGSMALAAKKFVPNTLLRGI